MSAAASVRYVNAPNGVAHTVDTVRRMARLATEGSHTYAIRSLATKITHKVPSKDIPGELAAIYTWVRDHIRYRFDPRGLEWIQAPERTIKEKAGDCDDMAILIAALAQSLGHRARFRTVGKTDQRQTHVHAQVWDGTQWLDLDPVLEPKQPTTKPRPRDLGAFGHQAPGAQRLYNQEGQPMGKPSNAAIKLWQPTNFEMAPQRKPRIAGVYRSRGSAGKPTPIRLDTWVNPYDPSDMGALGFNFLKAVGSVAKIASAVGVPGAGTISAGIDIGSKFLPKGKKGAAPGAGPAAPSVVPGVGPTGGGYPTAQQVNLAPIVNASLQASRDAIAALTAQNKQAIQAITSLAVAQRSMAKAKPAPKPKKKAARRQRWDAATRRWVVYEAQPMGAYKPSITLSLLGAFEPETAKALAPRLAASINTRGARYDRALASAFQTAAGITVDGKYGGGTAGALRYFLGRKPPRPLFAPFQERPYQAPWASAFNAPAAAAAPVPGYVRDGIRFEQATPGSRGVRRVGPARDPMSPAPSVPTAAPSSAPAVVVAAPAAPARRRRRKPRPSIPAAPQAFAPIASSATDPGLPVIQAIDPSAPALPSTPYSTRPGEKTPTETSSDNKALLVLGALYWYSKRRRTNGRRSRR